MLRVVLGPARALNSFRRRGPTTPPHARGAVALALIVRAALGDRLMAVGRGPGSRSGPSDTGSADIPAARGGSAPGSGGVAPAGDGAPGATVAWRPGPAVVTHALKAPWQQMLQEARRKVSAGKRDCTSPRSPDSVRLFSEPVVRVRSIHDTSPAFQGWVNRPSRNKVPAGTAERLFRPWRDSGIRFP